MKHLLPVAVVLACSLAVAGALTFDVTEAAAQQAATIGWALVAADGDAVVGSPTADHPLLAMLRERYRLDAPPDVDETISLLQRQSRKLQQFGGFGGLGGLGGFGGGKRPPSPPSPPPSPPDPPSPPPPSPTPPAPPAPTCDCEVFNNQVFIEYEDFINHPTLVDTIYGSDTDSYITQQDCCQLCRKTWGCKWWTLLLDDSNNNGECRLAGDFPEDQTLVFYNPWREASWLSAGYRWESRDTGLYTCVGSRANPASPPPPAGPPAPPTPPMPPNPPPAPKPPPAPPPSPTPPPRPPQPAARKPPIPRHPPSPNPPPSPSPRPPPPSPPDGSRPDVLTEGVTALSGSACSGCGDSGDLGCAGLLGAPRVQPLNDYRLVFMVKKGLDQYLANNNVYAVCGRDYRLYASPLIKFQKACYQLVSGNQWFLSVRIAYPCFGEARKINGRIVGYQAYGRWRTHNLYVRIVQLAPQYGVPQPYEVYEVYRY